jgi:hypothetical protein
VRRVIVGEHWRKEARIFEFCINHARQIIAELQTSGGDHYEDTQELEGLIEVWENLRDVAEEARLNEEQRRRNRETRNS